MADAGARSSVAAIFGLLDIIFAILGISSIRLLK